MTVSPTASLAVRVQLAQGDLPQREAVRVQAAPLHRRAQVARWTWRPMARGANAVRSTPCRIPAEALAGAVARDAPAIPEAVRLWRGERIGLRARRARRLEGVPAPVAARHEREEDIGVGWALAAEGAARVRHAAEGVVERLQPGHVDGQGEGAVSQNSDLGRVD